MVHQHTLWYLYHLEIWSNIDVNMCIFNQIVINIKIIITIVNENNSDTDESNVSIKCAFLINLKPNER